MDIQSKAEYSQQIFKKLKMQGQEIASSRILRLHLQRLRFA